MKKLLDKWLVNVWESEFVIKRKLKNIDDEDEDDDDVVENGERKQEDGEVMHGLNRIIDGNEERERGINGEQRYQGGGGHGQDQMEENDRANIIPEIDIVD